ncbi:ABC transporter permease [Candidatus Woesearchaeota archaeon]|nr:ABC transporter permease [Candidatus Woesearchaeota archaeon]
MLQDYISYVFENFRKRKMRSWLTMLGIFIGIAAVVALVSLGQGLQQFIDEQFEAFGTDKLIIQPKTGFAPPGSDVTTIELTSNDEWVVERTRGVIEATSFIMENVKVEFNEQIRFHQLFSIPTDEGKKLYDEINQFEVQDGRDVRKGDKFKVLVGIGFIEDDLFQPNIEVGDKIEINDIEFKVIGHYERIGNSGDDRTLVITEDAMREIFNVEERVDFILARAAKSEKPSNVAVRVEKELRNFRNLEEGKEDFVVQTSEDFIESFQNILLAVQLVLVGIAAISLLVGGIGITNTMYTAVLERTKEIGVMKAIGARNSDILKIFLLESGILGLAGGAIGVALGMGFSKLVEILVATTGNTFLKSTFSPYLIAGALLFAFLVGAISGVMPAIRASRLKPVDALRYE